MQLHVGRVGLQKSTGMGCDFYKVNAVFAPSMVPDSRPTYKNVLSISMLATASLRLSGSGKLTKKCYSMGPGSLPTSYHSSGCYHRSASEKNYLQSMRWVQQPSSQECPRWCSSSCTKVQTQNITKVVHTCTSTRSRFGLLREGLTPKRWQLTVGYTCVRLHNGRKMAPTIQP